MTNVIVLSTPASPALNEFFVLLFCFDYKDNIYFHVLILDTIQYNFCNLDVLQMMHEYTKSEFHYYLFLLQVAVEHYFSVNQ